MAFLLVLVALFLAALSILEIKTFNPWWGVVLLGAAMLVGAAGLPDPRGWFHRSPPPQ